MIRHKRDELPKHSGDAFFSKVPMKAAKTGVWCMGHLANGHRWNIRCCFIWILICAHCTKL